MPPIRVADAVGRLLADLGVATAFGVVGSGNFHVTNALVQNGVRFVAARHEGGAATMADAYSRVTGRPAVLTVHQGPGLTNALTGVTEAAKSRTPLLVLAADTPERAVHSNFRLNQAGLAAALGVRYRRLDDPVTSLADTAAAYQTAAAGATVLLSLPLDVQAAHAGDVPARDAPPADAPASDVTALADALARAERPVFLAGHGARAAADPLRRLARRCGALLAVSARAKGLFVGDPWYLDVAGGFASPLAAELVTGADLLVAWGCALSMWTTRHGRLVGPTTQVAQVDKDPTALGTHHPVSLGVIGDVRAVAEAVEQVLAEQGHSAPGYRSPSLAGRIATEVRWRDVPYADESGGGRIDPRTLSIALDDALPVERVVAVDSGNFMGYPSMFLSVPDEQGFCFTQAFQSIGLGLATAVGAALARPDRLPVAALGDGGCLMGIAELETVVRLGLPMVVVVYDDEAYGAEVHHFGPDGYPVDIVTFPPTDIAAIARGFGCDAATVGAVGDLAVLPEWLAGGRDRPLLLDAKVTSRGGSWWLAEAFGH